MAQTYAQLEALAPEAYLNPENFKSGFDIYLKNPKKYGEEQFINGLEIGNQYDEIHIACNSTWSASMKEPGNNCYSVEGIGYHSGTSDLLRGFLASTAAIIVHRYGQEATTIKQSRKV